jgi:hypothetical protein
VSGFDIASPPFIVAEFDIVLILEHRYNILHVEFLAVRRTKWQF